VLKALPLDIAFVGPFSVTNLPSDGKREITHWNQIFSLSKSRMCFTISTKNWMSYRWPTPSQSIKSGIGIPRCGRASGDAAKKRMVTPAVPGPGIKRDR
jgi:hypothetical protein